MRIIAVLLFITTSLFYTEVIKAQASIDIDSSYAIDGKNIFWLEINGITRGLHIWDVEFLPNGEILGVGDIKTGCSGSWTHQGILIKVDENGFLDTDAFDSGIRLYDNEGLKGIQPAPNGGYLVNGSGVAYKIDENGLIDTDFGVQGFLQSDKEITGLVTDNDGNLLVSLREYDYSPTGIDYNFMLSRYDENGVQDFSFGTDGLAYPVDTNASHSLGPVVVDSQNRIVCAGYEYIDINNFNLFFLRLLPDGMPDTTFGENGVIADSYTDRSRSALLQIDAYDDVLIIGNAKMSTFGNWGVFLLKVNAGGEVDVTFGNDGFLFKEVPGDGYPNSLNRMADGSYLLLGDAFSQAIYLAKFTSDGQVDTEFGIDGVETLDIFEWSGAPGDSKLEGDSLIIHANSLYNDCAQTKRKTVFMRYLIDNSGAAVFANPPDDISVCSTVESGISASVNLEANMNQIIGEQVDVTVTFHLSEEEATEGIAPVSEPTDFFVEVESEEIFVRVEKISDETNYAVTSFQVNVSMLPQINEPASLAVCDDDYDGYVDFDLTNVVDEVLGNQEDLVYSFYQTESDAEGGNSEEEIEAVYTNILPGTDTVWMRVEDVSGCAVTTSIELLVNPLPAYGFTVDTLSLCDTNADLVELINLTDYIPEMLDSIDTDNYIVSFFSNQTDAEENGNTLMNPENYLVENFLQEVYVGIEDVSTGCYVHDGMTILIILNPLPSDTALITDLSECDADFDGFEYFDLTSKSGEILGSQNPLVYQPYFFQSQEDAINNVNQVENAQEYFSDEASQTIFTGLQNMWTGCYIGGSRSFDLILNAQPEIQAEPEPLVLPQGEVIDEAIFDLTENNALMLGSQNLEFFEFSFFESSDDMMDQNNAIENPQSYTNLTNPQTIYVAMHTFDWQCTSYSEFELSVENELSAYAFDPNDEIKIYPVPAGEILHIECRDMNIRQVALSDMEGKSVLRMDIDIPTDRTEFDISRLTPGVYFLNLLTDKSVLQRKIVIR
jgi:uncharacterized delta-60 repeat protein